MEPIERLEELLQIMESMEEDDQLALAAEILYLSDSLQISTKNWSI